MQKILSWAKSHPLNLILILALLYFITQSLSPVNPISMMSQNFATSQYAMDSVGTYSKSLATPMAGGGGVGAPVYYDESSTDVSATNRKVITESHFSVVVKNIRDSISAISNKVEEVGGFVVNTSASYPEENANAYLNVRVPAEQRESFFSFVRELGIRVVSENISGRDVTDQFTDYQAQMKTLEKTKAKFEAMLDQATTIDETLRVQQSIIQVQNQIDSITGQLKYLENTSSSSLITINLATDEYSLPYAPAEPWRPGVIFKQAVRSLVTQMRSVGSILIYVLVYSPVIIVLAIGIVIVKNVMRKRQMV